MQATLVGLPKRSKQFTLTLQYSSTTHHGESPYNFPYMYHGSPSHATHARVPPIRPRVGSLIHPGSSRQSVVAAPHPRLFEAVANGRNQLAQPWYEYEVRGLRTEAVAGQSGPMGTIGSKNLPVFDDKEQR